MQAPPPRQGTRQPQPRELSCACVAWFAPQRDLRAQHLRELGGFGRPDRDRVVLVGQHFGFEDHLHAFDLEAELRRLARRRHHVEDGHAARAGADVVRFGDRHRRHADRAGGRAAVEVAGEDRRELGVGALGDPVDVAEQPRRQLEGQITRQRRRRGDRAATFQRDEAGVGFELLVEVQLRRQLEGDRARLGVGAPPALPSRGASSGTSSIFSIPNGTASSETLSGRLSAAAAAPPPLTRSAC